MTSRKCSSSKLRSLLASGESGGRSRQEDGLVYAVSELRKGLTFELKDGRKYGVTLAEDEQRATGASSASR